MTQANATPSVEQRRLMRDMVGDRVYLAADKSVRCRADRYHRRVKPAFADAIVAAGWAELTSDRYRLTDAGRAALDAADLRPR